MYSDGEVLKTEKFGTPEEFSRFEDNLRIF
jgi:hypothetical protein